MKVIALIDCNAFFVSCECTIDKSLIGRPVVVLSNNDGCVISRSNEAKDLGIPMGAPIHQYKELVRRHNVRVFSSNFRFYGIMSDRVMAAIAEISPELEVYSVDEAFADWSAVVKPEAGPACEFAVYVKEHIFLKTEIPVSIGLGPTKGLAKLANRIAKRDRAGRGVCALFQPEARDAILAATPLLDLWGVNVRMAARLERIGIRNALELAQAPNGVVRKATSVVGLRLAMELRGIVCRELGPPPVLNKTITYSRSFGRRQTECAALEQAISEFTARACERLRRQGSAARTITVFLHTNRFNPDLPQYHPTQAVSLPVHTADSCAWVRTARETVRAIFRPGFAYKKAGVILSDFIPVEAIAPSLFGPSDELRRLRLFRAVDALNARLGRDTVRPGTVAGVPAWRQRAELRSNAAPPPGPVAPRTRKHVNFTENASY